MDRDLCLTLIAEIEKVRKDLDKMQAYQKTMAEQLEQIAVNTTPLEPEPEPEPDPEPTPEAGGES